MSIRAQAAIDWAAQVGVDGDDVTLTAPGESPVTIKGHVVRTDRKTDPETGVEVYEPRLVVSVALSKLDSPPTYSDAWREWLIETTDVTGAAVSGYPADVSINATLGYVRMMLEAPDG